MGVRKGESVRGEGEGREQAGVSQHTQGSLTFAESLVFEHSATSGGLQRAGQGARARGICKVRGIL